MKTKYSFITDNVIFTRGYNRTLILDFYRGKIEFIPNSVWTVFEEIENQQSFNLHAVSNDFDEYLSFLLENEYIIEEFRDHIKPLEFISPSSIHDFLFICDKKQNSVIPIQLLEKFHIKDFLIISDSSEFLNELIAQIENTNQSLKNITVVYKNNSNKLTVESIKSLLDRNPLIHEFYCFNHNKTEEITNNRYSIFTFEDKFNFKDLSSQPRIIFDQEIYVRNKTAKGIYSSYLEINMNNMSARYSSNLDEEIKLQILEYLKNFKLSNIPTTSFEKDEIQICQDCEFRYVCCDRRIPEKSKEGLLYYQNECEYNPYISKFFYEKDYSTLEKSGITINSLHEVTIDKSKLDKLNHKIWQ
ncbi:MAG: hypothetical protein R2799_03670 [Crocinitomicaceae bacterium]